MGKWRARRIQQVENEEDRQVENEEDGQVESEEDRTSGE